MQRRQPANTGKDPGQESRERCARLLRASGREEAARAEERSMEAIAARRPATRLSPSAKSPLTYPNGLTAREGDVLRLVAQGLSDAPIAERLGIGPRTVNNHLTSICGKIQVSSGAAATRYAFGHQLVCVSRPLDETPSPE